MTDATFHSDLTGVSKDFRRASTLLFILVATFATLVPGGPIETRDFSHLGGLVFWGFNAYLIALALLTVASAFALRRGSRAGAWGAIIASWSYILVVLMDLGHAFPVSPDPIPLMLGLVEILDAILAGYVIALAHRALGHF